MGRLVIILILFQEAGMSFRGGVSWFVTVVVGEHLDPLAQSFHVSSEVHERSQHQLHIVSQLMVDSTAAAAALPFCLLVRLFSIFLPPQKEDTIIWSKQIVSPRPGTPDTCKC
jgi:hypothetical protein